jgi:hypothetical protein
MDILTYSRVNNLVLSILQRDYRTGFDMFENGMCKYAKVGTWEKLLFAPY